MAAWVGNHFIETRHCTRNCSINKIPYRRIKMKFILLMFTRSHKNTSWPGNGSCFKSLSEALEGHPQSQFDQWWWICWSSFLCNCNTLGNLEEIHLAKGNTTDMRYPFCRAFPMTINIDVPCFTEQSLSKFFLVSPTTLFMRLGISLPSSAWYKLSEEWPSSCGLKAHQQSCWPNGTYDPHQQSIHVASSVKKETVVEQFRWSSDCYDWTLIFCENLHKAVTTGKTSHESLKV